MAQFFVPDHKDATGMILPVSNKTFFNNKPREQKPLCAYDMLYHPPDFDPKVARSDRTAPEIIRKNIWDQEFHKPISSTTHMMYGRPYWPILDKTEKNHVLMQVTIRILSIDGPPIFEVVRPFGSVGVPLYASAYTGSALCALDCTVQQRLVKNQNPYMRIYSVLEWAVLLYEGKQSTCET